MFSASKTAAPATAGGYQVSNSLRFRSSASAYLSRTPASAGNRTTWTWSGWVKRGSLGIQGALFSAGVSTATFDQIVYNSSNDTLTAVIYASNAAVGQLITTQVFRDPSAWYHIVVVWDSTNATSANRLRMYVNGSQVTAFGTNTQPTQNASSTINSAVVHTHGDLYYGSYLNYFDGYMADINFIDGQALTPSSFGEYNVTTGVWQPKQYSGTYGTNGFKLSFSNGTSTTTLGNDSSGNGNNWTTNNISLTAGSTYDWMLDSPTPYQGSSYGVGNYAVLNPLITAAAGSGGSTLSQGNLFATSGSSIFSNTAFSSTIQFSAGKWYAEFTINAINSDTYTSLIVGPVGLALTTTGSVYPCLITVNGSTVQSGMSPPVSGDVIGIAVDADNKIVAIYKNNSAWGTQVTGLSAPSPYWSYVVNMTTSGFGSITSCYANFGQRPFAYTPPSGFKSLCTYNLPTPTIQNGAGYMAATLYTGNGTSQTVNNAVNGISFTPDFVWNKGRSVAYSHSLVDVIRGNSNVLLSNTTDAEQNPGAQLDITTNGFISTYRSANLANNQSGATYVAWQWKAGGTAVTNTAGSITSQVSANTTAGFSVVTYTGNGTASTQTIGHGLSSGLSMLIVKSRTTGGNDNGWGVSHTSIAAPNYLYLNDTGPAQNSGPGQGQPYIGSGSTFNINVGTTGTNNFNFSGVNYVAYCFAAIPGYSAFGSYTGNGSADGPFVYCGFRPRYVLVKATNSAENWFIWDTSRDPYNVASNDLYPNLSNAESAAPPRLDFLSNGFKCRASAANPNLNSVTYIYAAFCENPFQNALAR